MGRHIFACATALALATGMTSSAMAYDHGDRGLHSERFEGVRGYSYLHDGDWAGRRYGHQDDYGAGRGLSGAGGGTYCPAFSRCGAGLPD